MQRLSSLLGLFKLSFELAVFIFNLADFCLEVNDGSTKALDFASVLTKFLHLRRKLSYKQKKNCKSNNYDNSNNRKLSFNRILCALIIGLTLYPFKITLQQDI